MRPALLESYLKLLPIRRLTIDRSFIAGIGHDSKAPLPQIELLPIGGVSLKSAADFIKAGAMALGVGADLSGPAGDPRRQGRGRD